MHWKQTLPLACPPNLCFLTLRDRPVEVGARMAERCRVELIERHVWGARVVQRTRWSTAREVPPVVLGWVPDGALTWVDRSEWDEEELACRWSTVVELPGAEGVSVRGVDRFRPGRLDSETEVEVTLAGLPRWAARPLEDRIARAAGALIQPNVGQLLDAVYDLLAAKRSAA